MVRRLPMKNIDAALEGEPQLQENFIFEDVVEPGVKLMHNDIGFIIPDYLSVSNTVHITLSDHLNPAKLTPSTAYVYNDNLYLTDEAGNLAFIDCHLKYTHPTNSLRSSHPEYRAVGGKYVKYPHRDAGHIGLSIGQHPSFAMEQDAYMNRYGIWRVFERYWTEKLKGGAEIRLIGVFVEGEDTYSPFWCIHEEIDGEVTEYVFTNDDEQ